MSQNVRFQLWIVVAAVVIFFTNLGEAGLWDMDEALYSTCAREMQQRGDWVVPWFNGQMFPEKPPLMFWTMMAGYELFGNNEFGARFFSAVFGVLTALAAYHLGRILLNARVGLWSGLITASTMIFTISARAATVDSSLTLVTTAAFLMFVVARKDRGNEALAHHVSIPSLQWPYAVLMYAFVGLAVLAKGPVGMVLPLGAMGLYLLIVNGWRNVFRSVWSVRPLTAVVVLVAVAVPWYVWVGVRTDGQWLRQFFLEFNLRPFKQPILSHGDASSFDRTLAFFVSLLYYFYQFPAILIGFFPWSVLFGPTLIEVVGQIRRRGVYRNSCILASCWFGVWFVFWSICKTKLPHYLLPAYPALAMLTACFVDRWLGDPTQLKSWWLRNAWISMIVVGLGIAIVIAIVIPIVAAIYLPGEEVLGVVGLIPLMGGAWCWWQTSHQRHLHAAIGMAVTAVAFLTATFAWGVARVDRHQNAQPMIAAIRENEERLGEPPTVPPIATYRFFRESTVCYAGHPVTRCEGDDAQAYRAMKDFLDGSPYSYVITTDERKPELDRQFPGRFKVIFEQPCFLSSGNMVVLTTAE